MGVLIVNAIHHSSLEHHIGAHFHSAQSGCRIRGEERVAGAAAEHGDLALIHGAQGILAGKGLCHLRHGDGGEHLSGHTQLFQLIGDSQCVHHGCQHADLIGQSALHFAAGTAAPEVAAANHDADLHTQLVRFLHAAADRVHGGLIKTRAFFAAQCFAADLQKDTLIFQCHNPNTTCFYLPSGHRHTLTFFTIAYFTIKHP